jgi:hypothetical protein
MMRQQVIVISTDVFHVLKQQESAYVSLGEEKPGSTQKVLVQEDVYAELIDRAIAHRQTVDQVILEACMRVRNHDLREPRYHARRRSRRRFQ